MNMHITDAQRHAMEIRNRLVDPPNKADPVKAYKARIAELEATVELLRTARVQKMEEILLREREAQHKAEQLELDVADLQARLLAMADRMAKINGEMSRMSIRPVDDIIADVLKDYPGVTLEDVKGVRRQKRLIEPRHRAMLEVHQQRPDLSFPRMGKIFGDRDHTTVLHAVKKMQAREAEQ